jgi:hypothetical protein
MLLGMGKIKGLKMHKLKHGFRFFIWKNMFVFDFFSSMEKLLLVCVMGAIRQGLAMPLDSSFLPTPFVPEAYVMADLNFVGRHKRNLLQLSTKPKCALSMASVVTVFYQNEIHWL